MEDRTQHIDDYLNGRLPEGERSRFEAEIASNEQLRKEVEVQRKVQLLLEENERLKLRDQVLEISRKPKASALKIAVRAAAVILLLLIPTYFFVSNRYSDESLYQEYEAAYPDRITTMGGSTDISKAMSLYNNGKYQQAAKAFADLRSQGHDDGLVIYEAVSLRKSGRAKDAIPLLKSTLKNIDENKEVLLWELVLNYLANDQGDKALKELNNFLEINQGYQQQNAEELKSDLESFWR